MLRATLRMQCLVGVTAFVLIAIGACAQEAIKTDAVKLSPVQELRPQPDAPRIELKKRTVDRKFVITSVLLMGLTVADLERTQHCLHQHTCIEMNPMLPHSRAGMYAVNIPMNAAGMYLAYRLKSAGRRSWLIAPGLMSAGHLFGAAWRM